MPTHHIENPKIAARIESLMERLREAYPDGVVTSLQKEHKGLANKLGEAWQVAGYSSRDAMLEDYGFTVARKSGARGGRPQELDPEAVFQELSQRYASRPLPASANQLSVENPDLAAKLKSMSNRSRQLFGDTFRNVLVRRGLLAGVARPRAAAPSRADVEETLDNLAAVYADGGERCRTMTQLKRAHPAQAPLLDEFAARCRAWYGVAPKAYLQDMGILFDGAEDPEALIAQLAERYADAPIADKPRSMAALCAANFEQASTIRAVQAAWDAAHEASFVDTLRERGVIGYSEAALKRRREAAVGRCVRNAGLDELICAWRENRPAAEGDVLEPGPDLRLPGRALAVDLANKVKLVESTFSRVFVGELPSSIKVGDKVEPEILKDEAHRGVRLSRGKVALWREAPYLGGLYGAVLQQVRRIWDRWLASYELVGDADASLWGPLARRAGARVTSVSELEGRTLVQARLTYLQAFDRDDLVALLAQNGLVSEDDLRGGDEWRARLLG